MKNIFNKITNFLEKLWFIMVVLGLLWLWSQDFKYNWIVKETSQDRVDRIGNEIEATNKFIDTVLKCPKDYETKEEYMKALELWVNLEINRNTNLSANQIMEKREKYFKAQNCVVYNW